MHPIRRTLVLFALVAFSLPTPAAQVPLSVRTANQDDLPAPTTASLEAIEGETGQLAGAAFALYRWSLFPSVLVLDMADFTTQDRMFSRLAFFLEKAGYRGRFLTDAQLAGKHGWNAHDYGPQGLAAFFNKAAKARFTLDSEELLLRSLALREGILAKGDGPQESAALVPGSGAILSISRSSNKYERMLLLAHESYHGIYFCSAKYRSLCERLWKAAPASERHFMTRLLAALGYDPASHDLAVNEYQAYLLQQPRPAAAAYFKRVGKLVEDEAGVPTSEEVLPALLRDEAALERFLVRHFGMQAGGAAIESGEVG